MAEIGATGTLTSMPDVIVKLWPGKSEAQKTRLADAITKSVMDILHYRGGSVPIALRKLLPRTGPGRVFKPDIQAKWGDLYKKPWYDLADM